MTWIPVDELLVIVDRSELPPPAPNPSTPGRRDGPGMLAGRVARADPDPSWRKRAACRGMDPDLFFPSRGERVADAIAICDSCPVRAECLDYALRTGENFGIWGGTSERERRRIRRQRGRSRAT